MPSALLQRTKSPVRPYRTIVNDSGRSYNTRLLVGTATTGLVRIEWVQARFGQVVPCNWSMGVLNQYLDSFIPLRYQVADAQNLIVKEAINKDFEWLLLYEHDVIPPADLFIRLNDYMHNEAVPVVSGLYYSRSVPAEPLLYRGRGTSYYTDWQMGDKVWVDGVPTGLLLIHMGIIRAMWADSEEYMAFGQKTRRVFDTPRQVWLDPESRQYHMKVGTSDLEWCTRVMQGGYFAKAGWPKYQDMEFPFLCDTNIFCRHIDPDGRQYPPQGAEYPWKQNSIDSSSKRASMNGLTRLAGETSSKLSRLTAGLSSWSVSTTNRILHRNGR